MATKPNSKKVDQPPVKSPSDDKSLGEFMRRHGWNAPPLELVSVLFTGETVFSIKRHFSKMDLSPEYKQTLFSALDSFLPDAVADKAASGLRRTYLCYLKFTFFNVLL